MSGKCESYAATLSRIAARLGGVVGIAFRPGMTIASTGAGSISGAGLAGASASLPIRARHRQWISALPPITIPAVFERILKRMRELVRRGRFVMTTHADEEADADDLSVFDVESAILSGRIVQRQKDAESGEWKYVIAGQGLGGRQICVVAKIGFSKRTLYIITAYAE